MIEAPSLPSSPRGSKPHVGSRAAGSWSAAPAAAGSVQRGRAGSGPADFERPFDGLAGCYASELDARAVEHELLGAQALTASQVTLLAPADAAWLRYASLRRQWARAPHSAGRGWTEDVTLMALLGAPMGALAATVWWMLDDTNFLDSPVPGILIGAACGALLLALQAGLRRVPAQFAKFDRSVRRALQSGQWVVVTHDVRPARQADVTAVVCARSLSWRTVSASPWAV